jgi:hypothetical protein
MKNLKSLKTTLWGVGAILTALGGALVALFDLDPSTNLDLPATFAAIAAGVGLIMAKDVDEKN